MPYKNREDLRAFQRRWHQKTRAVRNEIILAAKAKGCALCPENDPVALAFHHPDPAIKEFTIGKAVSASIEMRTANAKLKAEIAKCVVLCHNCHAKVHAGHLELPASASVAQR